MHSVFCLFRLTAKGQVSDFIFFLMDTLVYQKEAARDGSRLQAPVFRLMAHESVMFFMATDASILTEKKGKPPLYLLGARLTFTHHIQYV